MRSNHDSKSVDRTDALDAVSEAHACDSTDANGRSRRGFLGRTAGAAVAAVASALGFARPGVARQRRAPATRARMRDLRRNYDVTAVESAVQRRVGDLLGAFPADGAFDPTALDDFAVNELVNTATYRQRVAGGEDAATVDAVEVDGEVTAHVTVSTAVADGRVTLHVQPEAGRAYAVHRPDEGSALLVDPDRADATTTACTTECSLCSGCCTSVCFGGQVYEEVCCAGSCVVGEPCSDCC